MVGYRSDCSDSSDRSDRSDYSDCSDLVPTGQGLNCELWLELEKKNVIVIDETPIMG